MSDLSDVDWDGVKEQVRIGEGWVEALITDAEVGPTKDGSGRIARLDFQVSDQITIKNWFTLESSKSEKAGNIGRSQLKGLAVMLGVDPKKGSSVFIGKRVGVLLARDSDNPKYLRIEEYKACSELKVATKPSAPVKASAVSDDTIPF